MTPRDFAMADHLDSDQGKGNGDASSPPHPSSHTLHHTPTSTLMDRLRRFMRPRHGQAYEPLNGGAGTADDEGSDSREEPPFSSLEYSVFLLLGVTMLWAWNMFLAAAPYFQRRFESDEWIRTHFQSAILSVFTVTNLGSMLVLTKLQSNASYPKRISSSLLMNVVSFTLLALSTTFFRDVSPKGYLSFLLVMVFLASLATGLSQNGVFSYASGYGRPEYTQAIMTGQAIAGVLPCVAEIVLVLAVPEPTSSEQEDVPAQGSSTSAFSYFLTATGISVATLVVFMYLLGQQTSRSHAKRTLEADGEDQPAGHGERQVVGLWTLFKKLHWLAGAIFICFAVTMMYPVFATSILSVRPPASAPPVFQPFVFIPLAFLFWNVGDLLGRLLPLIPHLALTAYPRTIFVLSLARLLYIPLYLFCNIRGNGAVVNSDFFYLGIVQLGFGITNGWLGSICMMGAAEWVDFGEREAAGGFMGLCLVGGLTVGSLLSFLAGKA
ncbi:MAG: hypothetical protein M1833_003562 [Piccolia ochrophora]|nr:MAG: hypothetical protein M1833_003562 [Piccolia ochrophora]